jgi:hypothetical protein
MPTIPNPLPNGTLLLITPSSGVTPSLTPYSARGLTQTLELIYGSGGGGQQGGGGVMVKRDVNGTLRDISDNRFRKYITKVSCRDTEAICLDGSWIGAQVVIECAVELSYPTGGTPQRPVVAGSSRVQGNVTYYRPQLTMLIKAISNAFSEYPAVNAWDFTAEEV